MRDIPIYRNKLSNALTILNNNEMKKITTFIQTIFMVAALLFYVNSTKAVVTMEYDGTTYLCDMNTEGNTIYIENCIGIIGEVEVTGTNGSSGSSDVGGWTDIPEPGYYPPTSGGGGGTSSGNNSISNKVDFRSLTDKQRVETILNALKNNRCILSEMFSFFPTVSYTSPPVGTIVNMCDKSYKIVLIVGSFNDDFAKYAGMTTNIGYFENKYGCWKPINYGVNSKLRILVSCEGDFDSFWNCVVIN